MTALSVNLNKIALLRNSREGDYPSLLEFANLAISSGVQGITVHPRPDQRHIRVDDTKDLASLINKHNLQTNRTIEYNIEGNPFAEPMPSSLKGVSNYIGFMNLIEQNRPHQATLVPDNNSQLTSDHGFDLNVDGERLEPIIQALKEWSVRCSLFMDPDCKQIKLAKELGADCIELYTGPYALAYKQSYSKNQIFNDCFEKYKKASEYAQSIGLKVNAGHDLNLDNLDKFLSIGNIAEVSIGHALTVDAILMGYKLAIQRYSRICNKQ